MASVVELLDIPVVNLRKNSVSVQIETYAEFRISVQRPTGQLREQPL